MRAGDQKLRFDLVWPYILFSLITYTSTEFEALKNQGSVAALGLRSL